MSEAPTLDYERRFRGSGARLLAGIDEVGRGALAGPVSVGIAVVDLHQQRLLADVRDSKLLKVADRERLVPLVRSWSVASAVGHASANEIDARSVSNVRDVVPVALRLSVSSRNNYSFRADAH